MIARGLEEIAPEERSRAEHYGAAAQLQCERARAAEAFVAPLLCARFSDLGSELSDETEHSIVVLS